MKEGYIKLYRSFTLWHFYKCHNVKVVFLHLLLLANYQEDKSLLRGQTKITLSSLADDVGLSIQKVRTALQTLSLSQIITKQSTPRYILITICNYEKYQGKAERNQHDNSHNTQHNEQHTTQERTSPTPPKKEYKELLEEGKEVTYPKALKWFPPSLEEIELYISEGKYNISPEKFYNYYAALKWHTRSGKPITDWKEKIIEWNKTQRNNEREIHQPNYTGTDAVCSSKQEANIQGFRNLFGKTK